MALKITRAEVHVSAVSGASTNCPVFYRVADENDSALGKDGRMVITLPAGVQQQIALLVEDALHTAGLL